MNATVQRLGAVLGLMAILAGYGGHWGVLQTLAWSGMVVRYSHDAGLVQGVQETFDGEHPCSLCTRISEARRQERSASELGITVTYPPVRHFATVAEVLRPPPADFISMHLAAMVLSDPLLDRPPTPPPRACA